MKSNVVPILGLPLIRFTNALVSLFTSSTLLSVSAQAQTRPGNALRVPPSFTGGDLRAYATNVAIWPGYLTAVLAFNGTTPGPTIRVARGQKFSARLVNAMTEPLTVHWHGVLAPADMDGHPNDPIAIGTSRDISFPVTQRAGTYWYHAHTDQRTARQAYLGLAGAFIVEDPAEDVLGLPSGDHDVILLAADKRPNASKQIPYAPTMMDSMSGFLGTEVLVNGTPEAWLSVDRGTYLFRLINGSNARIFKVGLSDGSAFHLLANDGGLLAQPRQVTSLMLPPGARVELLLDLSTRAIGTVVTLRSLEFSGAGMGMGMCMGGMGGLEQGTAMDMLKLYVDGDGQSIPVPSTLAAFQPDDPVQALRTRQFIISTGGMTHLINGAIYSIGRIDFSVPWDELEIWEFQNNSDEFHPMHPHGAHFQVLSRNGSTNLRSEDTGAKDTVLLNPNETVRVLIKFNSVAGLFVQHCHNLEHEDDGMMQNFMVQAPARLNIGLSGPDVRLLWTTNITGYSPQTSTTLGGWSTIPGAPSVQGNEYFMLLPRTTPRSFYRLIKP